MSADLYINMSNEQIPIYQNFEWNNPGPQIGKLYPREAFCAEYGEGFTNIYFRNSSGVLTWGYIHDTSDVSRDVFTYCIKYPYEKKPLFGKEYCIFKFRRSEEIYTPSGTRWGTVASGMRVACLSGMMGESHPDWMAINYVERSTDGEWVPVTEGTKKYGFVDIGLNVGSTPSTISMYGSW